MRAGPGSLKQAGTFHPDGLLLYLYAVVLYNTNNPKSKPFDANLAVHMQEVEKHAKAAAEAPCMLDVKATSLDFAIAAACALGQAPESPFHDPTAKYRAIEYLKQRLKLQQYDELDDITFGHHITATLNANDLGRAQFVLAECERVAPKHGALPQFRATVHFAAQNYVLALPAAQEWLRKKPGDAVATKILETSTRKLREIVTSTPNTKEAKGNSATNARQSATEKEKSDRP